MPYHYRSIENGIFNQKYHTLVDYLQCHQNTPVPEISNALANLPDNDPLKDLFVINEEGKSLLHLAAARENLILITFLKETGHNINHQDSNKKTPLYDACENLRIGSVNALLGYGAHPNLGDSDNIFLTVRQDGKQVFYNGENIPLVATIQSKAVVSAGQLQTITDSRLSKEALAEQVAAQIVKNLIEYDVAINLQTGADHFSALHRSVALRKPLIVKALADNHADFTLLSIEGMSALHMLVEYRSAGELQLADSQIQMQKEKEIADIVIPRSGRVYRLKAEFGNTALHTAVIGSNSDVVEALCKNDYLFPQEKLLSITNEKGNTAIHEALLEAHRGPRVLNILLRLATETDLETVNAQGESVKLLAKRLKDEAESIRVLVDSTKKISNDLEEFFVGESIDGHDIIDFVKFSRFQININALSDTDHLDLNLPGVSKQLDAIRDQLYKIRLKARISIEEAEGLNKKVERLLVKIDRRYSQDYIKTLASVTEQDLHAWIQEKLRLPNSFTGLESVANHQVASDAAHAEYNSGLNLLEDGDTVNAKIKLLSSIENYITLKGYHFLEKPYQVLARLDSGTINEVVGYELNQQRILNNPLSNHNDQLKAHMALASLYQTLRKDIEFGIPLLATINQYELFEQESFHFSEAYKFTQGPIDPEAHVVLQREMGVSTDGTKLGTYNIQQCVTVIAHDPNTQKVVLSHFDRFSGPLKFIDQILAEFPSLNELNKLDVYITGARDRSEVKDPQSVQPTGKEIADSNIKQVLKQFKVYAHLMNIRELSVGDKLSPPAVVFDPRAADGQRLQHRMPNRADSSLDSRALAMSIDLSNPNDYLQPIRKVDYRIDERSRKITFTQTQLNAKYNEYLHWYGDSPPNNNHYPETWKHNQLFKSLLTCRNEANKMMLQPAQPFDHELFQDPNNHAGLEISLSQRKPLDVVNLRQQNNQPSMDLIEVLRQPTQVDVSHQQPASDEGESRSELSEASANNDEWDEAPPAKKPRSGEDKNEFNLEKKGLSDSGKFIVDKVVFLDSPNRAGAAIPTPLLRLDIQGGETKDALMAILNAQEDDAFSALVKELFSNFNAHQRQLGLVKLTEHALYRANELREVMAAKKLFYMRSTVIASFSPEELSEHTQFFKDKFFQTRSDSQIEILTSLLNELSAANAVPCIKYLRKKRSAVECAGLDELINVDETQAAMQAKEITLLVATERHLLWQKNIKPLFDELNQAGERWYPLLETARDLGDDGETIEFINLRTLEKQIHTLSGKSSLNFLASLHELHQFIPQQKFRENVKNLADLKIAAPYEQFQYHENDFSGDFLLAIGLTTKTIINLINNKQCVDKVNNASFSTDLAQVECAVNIAGMSALYLTTLLQLTELIGKDFLTPENPLLKGLSVTSKVLGGMNVLFLLLQDGLDIYKLVQAKSEQETAAAITQLVIDGTLTAQTFVSLVAEGLIASVSATLIVPFMGLAVGLPSLVNNYETLLKMALQTGKFFNTLHEQQKKSGYEWITQTKLLDSQANEFIIVLNETQRFMKPVDTIVITKIDFVNKRLVLKGPWIYSSMNKGNCYYVDHHKEAAFDFREAVGLSNTLALSEIQLARNTWLLPLANFYINYQYQQEPTIIFRHDAELTTLRELQKNQKIKFISDEYCFPTSYGIYEYEIEYVPTTITIVADAQARTFMVPRLDRKLQGLLTYEMDTRGLAGGQGIIYLNPGVTIHLYLTSYAWILNGQNLSEDTIEFTQQDLRIGDVVIKALLDPHLGTASNKAQPLTYLNKQGHGFRLDFEQKQVLLMTINYAALQQNQQTIDEFLMQQTLNSPVMRVINYNNPDDGYQGTATYVVTRKRLFYTLNTFEPSNDALLISLQKDTAFFYGGNSRLLWCTETHTNRLLHYYVFPGEINAVSQQADDLLINVANQFYYKINTETKKSLLMTIQNDDLVSLFLKLQAFSSLSFVDVNGMVIKLDVTQDKDWQTLAQALQTRIRRKLADTKHAGSAYQKMNSEKILPNLNDISIGLRGASNEPPFIWLRKEQDHYQLISMNTHELDESALQNNEYRKANIKSGQYLGCFFDNQQADLRILSYFVKENNTDTTGKLYLQTVNAQQMLVSFNNTPPRLLIDLLVKNAVWNDHKLVILTADNTYQEIDASAQTSLIGFTADWVQQNPNWWQAVAVYLEKHPSKQVLISVQGIKDQQGKAVIVYYDHHVKQFIIINQANFDAVYHGKIAKVYFFTKDNCAYQVPGMTLEQVEALFNGSQAKQSLSALDKIADYQPLAIPTENDQLLMQKLPKFYFALQEFRMWLPQGVELAFDPKDGTWRVLAIQAGWFNQQQNQPKAVSDLFDHMAKLFKLKENQQHMPIPIETTDFCLVENHRFIEIPGVSWPNEQFNYLGQTDQPGYYFYDAHLKAIILLTSSNRDNFEKSDSHSIKPALAVEYATKLDASSVLLEIDPLQTEIHEIPLFMGCHQLLLMLTAHENNHLIALPERLMNHYSMIIYQAEGANPLELPNYSWFARKNQNSLMLSNGHSQLVIPYASNRSVPNIMIQVNYVHANQTQVLKENTLLIDRKLDSQPLKSIPILGYGSNWIEKLRLLPDAAVGHYQKDNLVVESVAVKSGQRMSEKPAASFLTQALVATVSAVTSFALTTAMGLSYVFIRRFWRRAPTTAIKNTLTAISIPMLANLPISEAQLMSNEDNHLVAATVEKLTETNTTAKDFQNGFYESEVLEQGFYRLAQSWSSVAAILAMEFKKRREQRFTQLDVACKIRLKQIEHLQAHYTLHKLTNAFIGRIQAKLKKTTPLNSTKLIVWIVNDLMTDYRKYLNDAFSESGLVNKLASWFNTFLSAQKEQPVHDQQLHLAKALSSASFNAFISHLFIDKVCQIYRDGMISEKKELAEKQKLAVLKIIPCILQSEEALVASLSVAEGTDFIALAENSNDKQMFKLASKSKRSLPQNYLSDSRRVSHFKPVNATEIEETMSAKKALRQYLK